MIQTVVIDIINEKVLKLLQDLELLQLIRVRREEAQLIPATSTARYKGAMSKQPLADIDNQLSDLRNGWE
jgi:hypothetical protein